MVRRALLLFSGGFDSTVTLDWALSKRMDVIPISFNYEGRPHQEREAQGRILSHKGLKRYVEVRLPFWEGVESPDSISLDLRDRGLPGGYIPVRNLAFYAIAGHYAEVIGVEAILAGHTKLDGETFPDASLSYRKLVQKILRGSSHNLRHLRVLWPLSPMSRSDIGVLARELRSPYDLTWSCWRDGEQQCGSCISCQDRNESIRALVGHDH